MKITIPFIDHTNLNEATLWQNAAAVDKSTNSGVYPLSNLRIWHTGIHLNKVTNAIGRDYIKPLAAGEIIAYRLIQDYQYFPMASQYEISESEDEIIAKAKKCRANRPEVYQAFLDAFPGESLELAAAKLKNAVLNLSEDKLTALSKMLRPYSNACVLMKHSIKSGDDTIDYFILYTNLAPLREYVPGNEVHKCFFREWKFDFTKIVKGNVPKINLYNSRELTGTVVDRIDTEGKIEVTQDEHLFGTNIHKTKRPDIANPLFLRIPLNNSPFFTLSKNKQGLSNTLIASYSPLYRLVKPGNITTVMVYYDKERQYPKIELNANAFPVTIKSDAAYQSEQHLNALLNNSPLNMNSQAGEVWLSFPNSNRWKYSGFVKQEDCFICYRKGAFSAEAGTGDQLKVTAIPGNSYLTMYEHKGTFSAELNKNRKIYLEPMGSFGYLLLHDLNQSAINNGSFSESSTIHTSRDLYFLTGLTNLSQNPAGSTRYTINAKSIFNFQKYSVKKWTNSEGAQLNVRLFIHDFISRKQVHEGAGDNALCFMKLSREKTGANLKGADHAGYIGEASHPARPYFTKREFVTLKFPEIGSAHITAANNGNTNYPKLTVSEGFYLQSDCPSNSDTVRRTVFTSEVDAASIILRDLKKTTGDQKQVEMTIQNRVVCGGVRTIAMANTDTYFNAENKVSSQALENGDIQTALPEDWNHFEYIGKPCMEGDTDVHVELFLPKIDKIPDEQKGLFEILGTKYTDLKLDIPALKDKLPRGNEETIDDVNGIKLDKDISFYTSPKNLATRVYNLEEAYTALSKCIVHCPSFWEYKEKNNIAPSDYGYPVIIPSTDDRYRTFIQKNLFITNEIRTKMGVDTQKEYYFFHPFKFLKEVGRVIDPSLNPYEGSTFTSGFKHYRVLDNPGFAPIGDVDSYVYNDSSGQRKFAKITGAFNEAYTNLDGYFYKYSRFHHEGVDFGAAEGTGIMCFINGKIISYGHMGGYGNTMLIKDSNKKNILYLLGHLSDIGNGFTEGSTVKPGDIVAKVGKSGPGLNENSYPAHLHLGIVITDKEQKTQIVDEKSANPKIYDWNLNNISTLYRNGFNYNSGQKMETVNR